jgi:hypothetical protein
MKISNPQVIFASIINLFLTSLLNTIFCYRSRDPYIFKILKNNSKPTSSSQTQNRNEFLNISQKLLQHRSQSSSAFSSLQIPFPPQSITLI